MPGALVITTSRHDVATTVQRLTDELRQRGVTLFAAIDHAAGARDVGLALPDEVLLVFGDPAVGTSLMQADPRTGIDLPLRLLVWSEAGETRIGFRDPHDLAGEFAVAADLPVLTKLRGLLDHLAAAAGG